MITLNPATPAPASCHGLAWASLPMVSGTCRLPASSGGSRLRPLFFNLEKIMELDLVDEMEWEDSDKIEKLSLEDAALEEPALEEETHRHGKVFRNGIHAYLDWFYDGSIENDDY